MSKNSKRPRMQKTVASDIVPQASSRNFIHSSNTSTRTHQVVTTVRLDPAEPTPSPQIEMTPPPFEDGPMSQELDPPAGVEVLKKPRRYLNSV